MIKIGKDIRVEVSEFKGKKYVGIRKWYEKDGKMLPGKGISMTPSEWGEFAARFEDVKKDIEGSF